MSSSISDDVRNSYVAALKSAMDEDDSIVREGLLQSLQMSSQGSQELDKLFIQVTSPAEATAHVHITERDSFRNHAADAMALSDFIKSIANAVKAQARSLSGNKRRSSRLLVTAIQPGSLDVVFEVPPLLIEKGEQSGTFAADVDNTESVDLKALNAVTAVLSVASDLEDDSLKSKLSPMPLETRRALKGIARTVDRANWDIEGDISTLTGHDTKIKLSGEGALRLNSVLTSMPEPEEAETLTGYIDGYRRSDGKLYLRKEIDSKKSSAVEVNTPNLIQLVSQYAVNGETKYSLSVLKSEVSDELGAVIKTKRILESITPVKEAKQDTLPI